MNNRTRILFGIITKSHTELALDDMYGLQELGYECGQFEYGAKKNISSKIGRFTVLLLNALRLLFKAYKFKPDFIFLNSRLEYVAGTRDFITILILKCFYSRKIHFLIKSHGSDLEVLQTDKKLYSKIVFPYLKRSVSGWLFLSTDEINYINKYRLLPNDRLFLVKNIVRIEKFKKDESFKKSLNIPHDYKTALYVGRLLEEKGIHFVVEAFAQAVKNHKLILIVVGDGEESEAIKQKIRLLKLENKVKLTGWVDESEAAYYTSNSDLLIFPTFFPEGFPMVLFNSLAAGLPVITTPTRAALDYLKEPDNCLWVTPKNSESVAQAIDRILASPDLLKKMEVNNKMKAKLFTKSVVARELSSILSCIEKGEYATGFIEPKFL